MATTSSPTDAIMTTFDHQPTVTSKDSLIQALDEDGVWSNAKVLTVHDDETVTVTFDGWRNQFNSRVSSNQVRERIASQVTVGKRRRGEKGQVAMTSRIIADDTIWFHENCEMKSATVVWVDPFTDRLAVKTGPQTENDQPVTAHDRIVTFDMLRPKPVQDKREVVKRKAPRLTAVTKKRRVISIDTGVQTDKTRFSEENAEPVNIQDSARELDQYLREDGCLLSCGDVYALGQQPFLLVKLTLQPTETITATLKLCKSDTEGTLTNITEDCTLICNGRHLNDLKGTKFSRQFTKIRNKMRQDAMNRTVGSSIKYSNDHAYRRIIRKTSIGAALRWETGTLSKNGRRKTFRVGPMQLDVDKELLGLDETFSKKYYIGSDNGFAIVDKIAGAQWDIKMPNSSDTSAHYLVVTSVFFRLDKTKSIMCTIDYISSGTPFTPDYRNDIAMSLSSLK
ncbi:Hypp8224 [Branchiostoma lanceolatum]|uniref:Hypp8224 protein n=1 Tax=Branchiostoma lanceolatum TaxID=7740 RepID=A0A8K0EF37_BRALA|nr:Hypp8224 [Branchiostoma lanceolatum]